jgi:hypothetical protein
LPESVEARAIFLMVRDPRDVAVSVLDYYDGTRDIDYVDRWSEYNRRWADFATGIVRYEDLLQHPYSSIQSAILKIDEHCSLEQLSAVIESHSFHEAQERYSVTEAWKPDKMYNRGVAGEWRKRLTSEQAQYLVEKHSTTMEQLGYL